MIEFKLNSITYRLDFSFFLLWAMIYLLGRERLVLPTFIASLVHEIGHIIIMTLSGRRIKVVEFSGTGIKIIPIYDRLLSIKWDIAIMSAGCISNFLLSTIILLCGIHQLYDVAYISISLGVFNLLPLKNLDGGSIIHLLKQNKT